MKIALIGYGNMGREIANIAKETKSFEIVSISYEQKTAQLDKEGIKKADVAIDFTTPQIVTDTVRQVVGLGTHMVIGTTGWYDDLPKVEKIVEDKKLGIIYGQNFSIGANIFFEIVKHTSKLFDKFEGYDVFGIETHHTGKKDSPSGTAKKISDIILANYHKKKVLQSDKLDRAIEPEELHFASVRGGRNFGRHEVAFDSKADEIRLIHQAWSRRGFAEGALVAAEFIKDKKGLYNFSDIFSKLKK